jgi:hypothetical protein
MDERRQAQADMDRVGKQKRILAADKKKISPESVTVDRRDGRRF